MPRNYAGSDDEMEYSSQQVLDDRAVVVMGVTGSGKSTFISHLTSQPVQIGHSLRSCTIDYSDHRMELESGRNLHIIDTPGFNDTTRSDADILKEIAFAVGTLRRIDVGIIGIVYLHRISDPRISGSALKSIRLFESLCGSRCFRNVVIVSTMWESLNAEEYDVAMEREESLMERDNFWGRMVRGGALVLRHDGSSSSARNIITRVMQNARPVTLKIQRELIDKERKLDETRAGRYLIGEFWRVREQQKREIKELEEVMAQAMENEDQETILKIEEEQEEWNDLLLRSASQRDELDLDFEDLAIERSERLSSAFAENNDAHAGIEELTKDTSKLPRTLDHNEDGMSQLAYDNERLTVLTEKREKKIKTEDSSPPQPEIRHDERTKSESLMDRALMWVLQPHLKRNRLSVRSLSLYARRRNSRQSSKASSPPSFEAGARHNHARAPESAFPSQQSSSSSSERRDFQMRRSQTSEHHSYHQSKDLLPGLSRQHSEPRLRESHCEAYPQRDGYTRNIRYVEPSANRYATASHDGQTKTSGLPRVYKSERLSLARRY